MRFEIIVKMDSAIAVIIPIWDFFLSFHGEPKDRKKQKQKTYPRELTFTVLSNAKVHNASTM
jgi:hypothetical protein